MSYTGSNAAFLTKHFTSAAANTSFVIKTLVIIAEDRTRNERFELDFTQETCSLNNLFSFLSKASRHNEAKSR